MATTVRKDSKFAITVVSVVITALHVFEIIISFSFFFSGWEEEEQTMRGSSIKICMHECVHACVTCAAD